MYNPLTVNGDLLSSLVIIKLVVFPLPWTACLTKGSGVAPKTLVPNKAEAKMLGGGIESNT